MLGAKPEQVLDVGKRGATQLAPPIPCKFHETAAAARGSPRQHPSPAGMSTPSVIPDSQSERVTLDRRFRRLRCRLCDACAMGPAAKREVDGMSDPVSPFRFGSQE